MPRHDSAWTGGSRLVYRLRVISRIPRRLFAFFAAILFCVVASPDAHAAAGQVKLKSNVIPEVGGGWHIYLSLELPKAPATAHVPLRFLFTKTVHYELTLLDGHNEPVETRQNLQSQNPLIESLDVGFSDGSGKIFKKTNFDFSLSRTRGYTPGEYDVQVRTADGTEIGGRAHVTFQRTTNKEDPLWKADVQDRRSITFSANSKGIKKVESGVENGPPKATTDEPAAMPQGGEVAPTGTAQPFIPDSAYQRTPEELGVKERRGCGCSVPRGRGATPALLVLALGLALALRRRRQLES